MQFIKLDPATAFDQAISRRDSESKLIVCGSGEEREYLEEELEDSDQDPQEIIAASLQINVEKWFRERMISNQEEYGMDEDFDAEDVDEDDDDFDEEDIANFEWTGEKAGEMSFSLANDLLTGKPVKDLIGVEINAEASWQIPAYFRYGGWNECPDPEAQCAIWKYWEEKYGAKIVGVSHDVIEAWVENPPQTKEDAMQLAMEQYLYCSDIVDQGVESVENLATTLFKQNVWFFWWD